MTMQCACCGRFIGDDCTQAVDGSSDPATGDWGWRDIYYCAFGKGCMDDWGGRDFGVEHERWLTEKVASS